MNDLIEITQGYDLSKLFNVDYEDIHAQITRTERVVRIVSAMDRMAEVVLDALPSESGNLAICCFLRIAPGPERIIELTLAGSWSVRACNAGGWLIQNAGAEPFAYWLPVPAVSRTLESHARIVSETEAKMVSFEAAPDRLAVTLRAEEGAPLDIVVWQMRKNVPNLVDELTTLIGLETQPTFTWSSQASCDRPADVYSYLIHGHIYQNAFAWPRKWKFCCELDGYELYLRLSGLELATGKVIYGMLKAQLVVSAIARQAEDGAWYHGEWTDLYECHYRFHAGGMQLLESALIECEDPVIRTALARAAHFVAAKTDETDLGLWFLHDTLEDSSEAMDEMPRMFSAAMPNRKGLGTWKPSSFFGKSPTNKMVFNTHIDTTVTLERYRQVTGDQQYAEKVASANRATLSLLAQRPAEYLFRPLYALVNLAMTPGFRGETMPLPVRAIKRLAAEHLTPKLYYFKKLFPRVVMPNGFIDRHLGPVHFDAKYHAVNILDLVRLWRQLREPEIKSVIDDAIEFVMRRDRQVLQWWADQHPRRFAIVVFAEALCHLCLLDPAFKYREYLAEAILLARQLNLGLPPSISGGNCEILLPVEQVPCPNAGCPELTVVNIGARSKEEVLVINISEKPTKLNWVKAPEVKLQWRSSTGAVCRDGDSEMIIAARDWVCGVQMDLEND